MTAANKAAAVFKTSGATWQDRPVKPPPYVPTVKQIEALYVELLAKVKDAKPSEVTGRVYAFEMARGLRVVRLTQPSEKEQRFSLQVEATPGKYEEVEIVDAAMAPAKCKPPPPPEPAETKEVLRAKVADLETRLAAVEGKQ